MLATLKKYNVQTTDQATLTEALPNNQEPPILLHQYIQVDLEAPSSSTNTSKLSSAHDLLKQLNASSHNLCSRCEEQLINTSVEQPKEVKRTNSAQQGSQQVSN